MVDVNDLLKKVDGGEESDFSFALMAQGGMQNIQQSMGLACEDFYSPQVKLMHLLVDDSTSIRMAGNTQVICDGYNMVIDALRSSKQKEEILIACSFLNKGLFYPYTTVEQALDMTPQNYNPNGGTPLYDKALELALIAAVKAQEYLDKGLEAQTVNVIITDGADCGSRQGPQNVEQAVKKLLVQERHIFAGMGIDDKGTDFRQVFREMGIPDEWIITPGNTESEIRRAFAMVSQSAVRASQMANISQLGGFGK